MRPRDGRRRHGLNDNNTRQEETKKFVNFTILNNILNTVNLNNETARRDFNHNAENSLNGQNRYV